MTVKELLEQYGSGHRDFGDLNLAEGNLSRAVLSHANLSHAILSIANLSGANLTGANLSYARMNVARLSGANLTGANLTGAILNVANTIRTKFDRASLVRASLVRAEMIRASMVAATLVEADLSTADMRESQLDRVDATGANFSETDLRGSSIVGSNLTSANLTGCELSKSKLTGSDLGRCEMRHARLHRADLSGVSLRGANLRWADLSGANLRWADLTDAKLSGANLIGADLSNANLLNTSFVHADLTQASLIGADLEGADLSGATLTGAKLHGVARFHLRTQGMTCEWVDISPNGDHSQIYRFTPENFQKFFNQTPPVVQIAIDSPIDSEANLALAQLYHAIAQEMSGAIEPPSIDADYRRTMLRFRVEADEHLFTTLFAAILPFADAKATHKSLSQVLYSIQSKSNKILGVKEANQAAKLSVSLLQTLRRVAPLQKRIQPLLSKFEIPFLSAPTQTSMLNSSDLFLQIYGNPRFGKRFLNAAELEVAPEAILGTNNSPVLPTPKEALDFVQGFYSLERVV
ncbi:MAG: pentapeptide repeat-containing protein [Geitlerinemataceae cyanobacterium]